MGKNKSLSVGFFIAVRDIKRSNPWVTVLITLVMTLTFINMLFAGGILLGLATGAVDLYKTYYSGNVIITPASDKNTIEKKSTIMGVVQGLPTLNAVSERYMTQATLEYGYQNRIKLTDIASEGTTGLAVGIDPVAEDRVTNLSKVIIAGSYLNQNDADSILVGSGLTKKYASTRGAVANIGTKILITADVGSRVRMIINGIQKEVTIKGIVSTNSSTTDSRIYMVDSSLKQLLGVTNLNPKEIAITLVPGTSDENAKNYIIQNLNNDQSIIVQTAMEAIPGGILDVFKTLRFIGNLIGSIGLIVGAITIFIVIFVNAITRRKYIGILKGIGVSSAAIEISYTVQALFYAISGITLGAIIIMALLKPYLDIHPINTALAPAVLSVSMEDVFFKGIALLMTAFISGFIPAWLITKQNTLDAILGR